MYDTVVGCEGYEYPDDPYILEGSCQVEFKLRDTGSYTSSRGYGSSHSYSSLDYSGISFSSLVMVVGIYIKTQHLLLALVTLHPITVIHIAQHPAHPTTVMGEDFPLISQVHILQAQVQGSGREWV